MDLNNSSTNSTESFQISAEPYPFPTSDGEEDDSFVILHKGSLNDINSEQYESMESSIIENAQHLVKTEIAKVNDTQDLNVVPSTSSNNDVASTTSSLVSTSNLTNQECLAKLEEVLQENTKLKMTMEQNNMSTKSQYDLIIEWQKKVQSIYEDHKNKFAEVKAWYNIVRCENNNLKDEIAEYKVIKALQEKEIVNLKGQLNKIGEAELLVSSESTSNKIDELEKKLEELRLKSKDDNYKKMNPTIEEIKFFATCSKDPAILINQLGNIFKEINELQKTNDVQLLHFNSLKEENEKAKKDWEQTLSDLKNQKDKELSELKKQFASKLLQKEQNDSQEMLNLRHQLMNSQKTITDLEQELTQYKNKLEQKQGEIDNNKKCFEKINDEMYALQAQLEVYKTDFEVERNAKESIKTEKDQIAEDLKNLQRRNRQLVNDIEALRENNDFVLCSNVSSTVNAATTATSDSNSSPPLNRYICPICNKKFRSLMLLESHIEHCINTSD